MTTIACQWDGYHNGYSIDALPSIMYKHQGWRLKRLTNHACPSCEAKSCSLGDYWRGNIKEQWTIVRVNLRELTLCKYKYLYIYHICAKTITETISFTQKLCSLGDYQKSTPKQDACTNIYTNKCQDSITEKVGFP